MDITVKRGLSIETWVRFDLNESGNWERIIDIGNGATNNNIILARNGTTNNLTFRVDNGATTHTLTASDVIKPRQWLYIVATVAADGSAKLYVNGQEKASGTLTAPLKINRTSNYIGKSNTSNNAYFQGQIADLKLWTEVLDIDHVLDTYHQSEQELVGDYNFEGNAADNSPAFNHATPFKGVNFRYDIERGGLVAKFDGVDDYIGLPDLELKIDNGLSFETWVKFERNASGNRERIIDLGKGQSSDNIILSRNANSNDLTFSVYSISTPGSITATDVIRHGEWMHVAATVRTDGQSKLYINGEEKASGMTKPPGNRNRVSNYIGKSNWSTHSYFRGSMDNLRIWQKVLTSQDVRAIVDRSDPLVADYRFLDNAKDFSGRGHHGTAKNGLTFSKNGFATFDGTNDYIQLPDLFIDWQKGFSLEVVVKFERNASGNWERILDLGNGQADNNLILARHGTTNNLTLEGYYSKNSGKQITAINAIIPDKWMHIVATITYDGETRLYVNGKQVTSGKTALPRIKMLRSNFIGKSNWSTHAYFDGQIDGLKIWEKVLSPQEVWSISQPPRTDLPVSDAVINAYEPVRIVVSSSEKGVSYQLRKDSDNSLVGEPGKGNGAELTLFAYPTQTTTYNVIAIRGNQTVELTDKSEVEVIPVLKVSTVSADQIQLTWIDISNNESGYRIERKTGTGNYTEIATVGENVTRYNSVGLTENTIYTYRIRAYHGTKKAHYSNELTATTRLNKPASLTAESVLGKQINFTWTDNSAHETGYKIERKSAASGYVEIAKVGANVTSYNSVGLTEQTPYSYRVRAYNAVGNSSYSNEINSITTICTPGTLETTAISTTQIDLSWTDNSGREIGYKIERKAGNGNYTEVATVGANVTRYSDTGLMLSTTYTYRVKANAASVESAYSNESTATTFLAAPTRFLAAVASSSEVYLSWTDNSNNETGFVIERKQGIQSSDNSYAEVVRVGANVTSYHNTGLNENTFYTYRVRSYSAVTTSNHSDVYTALTWLSKPTTLSTTTLSTTRIDLSWTDNSSHETAYKIERKAGNGSYVEIARLGANVTHYSDAAGLTESTTYTYRVKADGFSNESAYSNQIAVSTTASQPNMSHGGGTLSNLEEDTKIQVQQEESESVILLPNPAKSSFTLRFSAEKEEQSILAMYSLSGKTVLRQSLLITKGNNEVEVHTKDIPGGIYVVRFKKGGQLITAKVTLTE